MKKYLDWKVGFSDNKDNKPVELFTATVPGAVQLDYAQAYNLPPYYNEMNFRQYLWMEDKFYRYSTTFDAGNIDFKHLFFVAKGIDYKFAIYINDTLQYAYEGMYHEINLDLTEYIGTKFTIEILIYPVPKSDVGVDAKNTRDEANQTTKPAVSYGWDFHPRLTPLGIWDDAYIELSDFPKILKPDVTYVLSDDLTIATVKLSVNTVAPVKWEIISPEGEILFIGNRSEEEFTIKNPLLWWCNGYGSPNLYTYRLTVTSVNENLTYDGHIGFKTVSLNMNEGAWDVGDFPKSRSYPPITICLNGVEIFSKGTNWVSPEIFYGTLNEKRYREQLELVKEANLNIVRCWGGSIVNKEPFFQICDELGIMVWQEFPLACNNYIGTDYYLNLLKREATDIIDRVSKHACLVLWCGGNELFNSWSGMTDQSLAVRLLNKLTFEKTPHIPFIPTAPIMGMGHGSYRFLDTDGREVMEVIEKGNKTAYTEFGVPALSSIETMRMVTNPETLFPFEKNEVTVSHHAFGAWGEDSWSSLPNLHQYFGKLESLEELIKAGQLIQGVGYRYVFEEARRQKPRCSMAINWCFNEPWPCLANNSIICYPNQTKSAYYEIKNACRKVEIAAKYHKLCYHAGEMLEFDLWVLNDGKEAIKGQTVTVSVEIGQNNIHLLDWKFNDLEPNKNFAGPTVRYQLPNIKDITTLKISLLCGEYSSSYLLLYKQSEDTATKVKILNM